MTRADRCLKATRQYEALFSISYLQFWARQSADWQRRAAEGRCGPVCQTGASCLRRMAAVEEDPA